MKLDAFISFSSEVDFCLVYLVMLSSQVSRYYKATNNGSGVAVCNDDCFNDKESCAEAAA